MPIVLACLKQLCQRRYPVLVIHISSDDCVRVYHDVIVVIFVRIDKRLNPKFKDYIRIATELILTSFDIDGIFHIIIIK